MCAGRWGRQAAGRIRPCMDAAAPRMPAAKLARAPFREAVLVCGKCARKLGGGFGRQGRQGLRGELKRAWKASGRVGKLRVVEASCLGLCPKRRQVVATGVSLAAGRLWVVEPGEAAAAVLARLLPAPEEA